MTLTVDDALAQIEAMAADLRTARAVALSAVAGEERTLAVVAAARALVAIWRAQRAEAAVPFPAPARPAPVRAKELAAKARLAAAVAAWEAP